MIAKLIQPTSGKIIFNGQDITSFSEKKMKSIRGDIQMIFQDPFSSLNPRQTIGSIISMPLEDMSPLLTIEQLKAEMLVGLDPNSERVRA
jgi:ABC-type microcin C transport system duplicated ATPase subunit YejF